MPTRSSSRSPGPRSNPLARYEPLPATRDEMIDEAGNVRAVWRPFIDHLAQHSDAELAECFARGDQYLRDAGVFYRQYSPTESQERPWPLSHVPVLIHEAEWRMLAEGLVQRAELLEAVMADLYGENRLVADGYLPAELVAASREWLRPMVGVKPRSGHYLSFLAFEIGRGPDGRWCVLGDRTQAPSGAGFALENRLATSRVFAEFYPRANVHRLAGFFRTFRDELLNARRDNQSLVGILTPGPHTDTYYEHAYIARYLGLMLLEGEDLTVERGELMVRTVEGLRPISVLWRRLDSTYVDPLELNENSRLGTPGLLGVLREGSVSMVNAVGAGVLEMRALFAFLPRISEALLGAPLAISNIATWWCGGEAERAYVKANAERMAIGAALSTKPAFDEEGGSIGRRDLSSTARGGALDEMLERRGAELVAQEALTLSTTPVLIEGRLAPRPMSLRVFLARTPRGWTALSGGYARIGRFENAAAIAMQRGGAVADVWVVSDKPVESVSMLPAPAAPHMRAQPGVLPSRAADNLYWLGRYVERAESLMRLLRAYHMRLSEGPETPIVRAAAKHLEEYGADPEQGAAAPLRRILASAVASASRVRDRFSVDGWWALRDLADSAGALPDDIAPGFDTSAAIGVLLRKIAGFSGLVHENMYRHTGWRFMSIGRAIERAMITASALEAFADPAAPDGAFDFALEMGDSVMTYRRMYAVATERSTVIDLLAFDTMNPRAILHQLGEIRDHVALLPSRTSTALMSPLSRAVLKTHTALAVRTPESLDSKALNAIGAELASLSDLVTDTYLR